MKTIFKNSKYQLVYHENLNILILDWSADTENMNDDDFREALSNYAGYVSQFMQPKLLVDTTKLKFSPSPEGGRFRNESCLPRFMSAGAYRLAYVMPIERKDKIPTQEIKTGHFTDKFFTSLEDGFRWLTQQ